MVAVDHIPSEVGLPPKPMVKKGLKESDEEKDYKIIKQVEKINRSRSTSRARGSSRSRAPSQSRNPESSQKSSGRGRGRSSSRTKDSNDWSGPRDTRDTSLLGVRSERKTFGRISSALEGQAQYLGAMARSRSSSRARVDDSESEGGKRSSSRLRSFSRGRGRSVTRKEEDGEEKDSSGKKKGLKGIVKRSKSRLRSLSRGRSSSKTRDKNAEQEAPAVPDENVKKTPKRNKLPPSSSSSPKTQERKTQEPVSDDKPPKPDVSSAPSKKKIPDDEADPDALHERDVMNLDPKNSSMHVACLLHYPSEDVIKQLEENPSLAFETNTAGECPLHYAAMDKKGVRPRVLKKLVQTNPSAVKQANVQRSFPIHLACMVGAPDKHIMEVFLKLYPASVMSQTDFPLMFDDDMTEQVDDDSILDNQSHASAQYSPRPTGFSGIAKLFSCGTSPPMEQQKRSSSFSMEEFSGPKIETGFSALHLAVMNGAAPEIIELLIDTNPRCVHIKTTRGRTALDCGQYIVRQHWLYGTDDEKAVLNTFAAIEILEEAAKK